MLHQDWKSRSEGGGWPAATLRCLLRSGGLALFLITLAALPSCELIFGEPTMDPCDPAHNYYEGDRHYIGRDYVQEDGTLNQEKMLDALRPGYGGCADPLKIAKEKSGKDGRYPQEKVRARTADEIKFPDPDLN
ncbi:MAG: hypothetical protein KDK23_14445 [Leptospiraceae bacterium]|nr:hypothetical protein [Leptospiraceae bacterium]